MTYTVTGAVIDTVTGAVIYTVTGAVTDTVTGAVIDTVTGAVIDTVTGAVALRRRSRRPSRCRSPPPRPHSPFSSPSPADGSPCRRRVGFALLLVSVARLPVQDRPAAAGAVCRAYSIAPCAAPCCSI